MKVKLKCKKCGFETEADIKLNPLGSLKPGAKIPGGKEIKLDKDSLDKLMDSSKGATRDELEKIGIPIPLDEWEEAVQRQILRRFLLDNLKISKTKKQQHGEKYVVANAPWVMGDSFRDVDLTSSEVKNMGVEDLRMIPGLTMQKKVYGVTKGRDTEELKGVKFLVIIDCSGSMIEVNSIPSRTGKIARAFLVGKEIWELSRKLGFEYMLVLFSDNAVKVDENKIKNFWMEATERASYTIFNGGTSLAKGLGAFTDEEYKDANVVILTDMDLGDFLETKEKILDITKQTNSFKIVIIEDSDIDLQIREKATRDTFPPEVNLKIMLMPLAPKG